MKDGQRMRPSEGHGKEVKKSLLLRRVVVDRAQALLLFPQGERGPGVSFCSIRRQL